MGETDTTNLSGKVVLITGAASGIGRALAKGFLSDGARVASLNHHPAADAEEHLENSVTFMGDVTSAESVASVISQVLREFGRIDVLVNNAGVACSGSFLSQSVSEWSRALQVNLLGSANCLHAVLPVMIQQEYGRVINVVSRSAEQAIPGTSAYASSKAALISFMKVMAREVGPPKHDILINGLIPGPTKTRLCPFGQPPAAVYPHCRFVATLPKGGAAGKMFWESKEYSMFETFND